MKNNCKLLLKRKLLSVNSSKRLTYTQHPNAHLITGMIYGYRVEEIPFELTKKTRYLDKLVDELAKGKKMEKILRQ